MNQQKHSYGVNGSSALKHAEAPHSNARVIQFPSDLINAERSYGIENVSCRNQARSIDPARGSLAGRPLNMFSKAETAAMFVICTVVTFAAFFCI